MKKKTVFIIALIAAVSMLTYKAHAATGTLPIPKISLNIDNSGSPKDYVDSIKVLILITVLSLAPSFIVLMTSFTRIIVVLSFVRNALSTQQTPPNQVLIALALFLTFFIMSPVYSKVNSEAVQPYLQNKITQEQAIQIGEKPIKEFMLKQTYQKDLALFVDSSKIGKIDKPEDTPLRVLIPAFTISELKTAFEIGFLIYIPFIVIDMVVASILMSMGMFMLPPITISLPFKILLFIMVDGWNLVVKSLIQSFM
ncbi:MAG: flagellar type III secretion system pore protein FliP [Clostridiales bacterium]|nr:flagellar type III secretion system pore protein FliP [Clostridiales bacterium]HBM81494.1 flagellar biosynthetic protein FliP [Clostridiaceae bacterium]